MAAPDQQSRYQTEAGTFLSTMDEMAPQVGLDYSVDSLQRLDQFITEHFEPPGSKPVAETLPVGIGCYLGEVIIRHIGGYWNEDGEPQIDGLEPMEAILPIEKARKRFENGRQDSLSWYYHAIAKRAYEAGVAEMPQSNTPSTVRTGRNKGLLGFLQDFFKR